MRLGTLPPRWPHWLSHAATCTLTAGVVLGTFARPTAAVPSGQPSASSATSSSASTAPVTPSATSSVPPAAVTASASPPAPVDAPVVAPAPAPTPSASAPSPESALVHLGVDYRGAWLELRSAVDEGEWRRACAAPCDQRLLVEGMEARVSAPGMATSNTFRIEPGRGTARFKVSGGGATARRWGVIGLVAGGALSLGGFAMYGGGRIGDAQGLETAGLVTLGLGAASVLVSLPLLLSGTTTVRDARGNMIARPRRYEPSAF